VVFYDLFSQKYCLPLSFIIIIVHGKMKNLSLFIIIPVLGTISSKNRMFHGKKEDSSWPEPLINFPCKRRKIFYIMKGQGTEHNIKGMPWKLQIFHGCSHISNLFMAVDLFCLTEHLFGKIYAKYLGSTFLYSVSAVPSIAAAQIQDFFICEIRHHLLEFLPLSGTLKTVFRSVHLTVFLKKHRIIILVFFHRP